MINCKKSVSRLRKEAVSRCHPKSRLRSHPGVRRESDVMTSQHTFDVILRHVVEYNKSIGNSLLSLYTYEDVSYGTRVLFKHNRLFQEHVYHSIPPKDMAVMTWPDVWSRHYTNRRNFPPSFISFSCWHCTCHFCACESPEMKIETGIISFTYAGASCRIFIYLFF